MKRKPCGRAVLAGPTPHGVVDGINIDGCAYPRAPGKQQCIWHWLMKQPADVQSRASRIRLARWEETHVAADYRARVPVDVWSPGERWCSGCQSFVPLFYTTGSRCKACASAAAHGSRVEKLYGITPAQYDALLRLQGGVCYICQRRPRTKRLAVDHDHKTGEVRGLLCANNEHGCNRGVVANLEAAADGGLAAARRAVDYLTDPPFKRLQRGQIAPTLPSTLASRPDDPPPPF